MSNFSIFFEMNSTLPGNFGIGAKMCKFVSYHAGSQNTGKHFWYYQNPPRFVLPHREKGSPEAGEKVAQRPGKRLARGHGKDSPKAGEKVFQRPGKRFPRRQANGCPKGRERVPQRGEKKIPGVR